MGLFHLFKKEKRIRKKSIIMGLLKGKSYIRSSALLSPDDIFLCNIAYAYGDDGPAKADPGCGGSSGRRDQSVCLCGLFI